MVFGASLNQFTMRFGELFAPGTRVFQIDIAPAATHPHVGGFVRADARVAAEALVAGSAPRRIDAAPVGCPGARAVDVAAARARTTQGDDLAADGRLDPRSAARRIAELLPERPCRRLRRRALHRLGEHVLAGRRPDRMMMVGTAFQSIGLGWPSVVGAALARRESTVVLTSGDGGGLMAIADLESAVRAAGGRGIAVIWNDAAYGAEVNLYGLKGLAEGPMRIPEVDFAAFGAAVGAEGVVVRTLADLDRLGSRGPPRMLATPAASCCSTCASRAT